MQIGLGIGIGHNSRRGGGAPYVGPYSSLTTSPVIAAGFSRLHAGYTGPLIRLLRADDDAEMDFGYVAGTGLLDTTAIATWGGASALLGRRWYNQYTAGEDYVQATKAAMPTFDPDGLNSGPCFTFDGSNDYLEASITAITNDTLFNAALVRPLTGMASNDGIAPAYNSASASDYQTPTAIALEWLINPGAQATRNSASAQIIGSGGAIDNNWVYACRVVADGHYVGINGTEGSKASSSGNFNINRHLLGGRWVSNARSNFMVGSLAGVALFNVDPGTTDRGIVVDYLKSVGGIS